MASGEFRFPTNIKFGEGCSSQIPELLKVANVKRPLIVTDKGLSKLDILKNLVDLCKSQGLAPCVFSDAEGNPIKSHVTAGVVSYKTHKADGFVIVGGGCALDVGKAIALMVNHPGDLFQYEDEMEGALPIDQPIPYMIAVPTTSGTGSEVGASAVISDDKTHAKKIIYASNLTPNIVVADPALTVGLPAGVTAATGMDALTHNIEAYLAKNYHPMCDGIALEGIRLVVENLKTAVDNPSNLEARGAMLMASMMGAVAFQKGLGVTHSCAHSLSTCYDLHHGLANALMLIPCLEFNYEKVPERFAAMGQAIGLEGSDSEKGLGFIKRMGELRDSVGISGTLEETNGEVTESLVDVAFADACHPNNPRKCERDDFKALYLKAIGS